MPSILSAHTQYFNAKVAGLQGALEDVENEWDSLLYRVVELESHVSNQRSQEKILG